ncbi:MAG TPA: amino acid adenylation domain-containing protein, partial [Candidatus Kapabacteria bacterium]|nr:amino acid adenylation domain-containing protein [Candidatus Kapabacteria bacterium]
MTAEKFIESPYGRYYRTGDLGRWLPNGKIEFLGRIDLQVKIRGFRVELAEIENRLANHPSVKESVVLAKEILQGNSADKYLCAYIVLKPAEQLSSLTPQEISSQIKEFLVHDLPEYMLPSYFIYIDKIPLTLNGKIDLKALPAPGLPSGKNYSAPRDIVEEKLAGIWADVLLNKPGNASASGIIGIDDNFFQVGGQSLKAVIMLSRVHRELHVKVPLSEVFKAPTIKGLANFVRKSNRDRYASIEPAEKKEYYALSSAQKRLYILQQINWQSTAYNMPEVIPLGEMADIQGLTGTFQELINRHESLRTSFHLLDDQPVQKVHDEVAFAVEERSGEPVWTPVPFDLAKAPLLRAVSMKNQANQHFLMVDMHHIISDGVSHAILLTDFIALYNGESLSPLRIQYKDFSEWQNSEKEKENLKKQETYWLGAFAEEIPVLELPADFARPVIQAFEGNALRFQISAEETKALKEMAFREGVTLYMLLLALYTVFIGKLSGQEDIVLGSPAAGRRHADLERILGVFINTLALRNYPVGEKSFSEFLKEVKVKTIEAFENQDYPFEDLVDKVVTGRDAGRNPLFDVMIILQNIESGLDSSERPDRSGGSRGQQFLLERETSKFDLVLNGSESNEGLNFSLAYSTRLFKRETVERFLTYLKSVFTAVLDDPQLKISNIEIIPEEEKKKILFDFNGTEVEYPWNKTIDRVFAEQVEKIPDHMAVFGHGHARVCPTCLTYHELNEQSGKLAGLLIEKGIQPDSIVAIMMERSVEMIIGIMGILKSGGAYLPIDPNYPQERIDYMLRDSHAKLLIINKSEIRNSKFETNPNDQKINDQNKIFEELMVLNFKNLDFEFVSCFGFRTSDFNSSNLAYIIYTSGTTGRPKGVMVRHCNLANLVWGLQRTIYRDYPGGLHVCFVSPYIFDASVKQIFASLLLGHCLYVVPENVRLDGVLLLNYYEKYKIDISDGTPTHLRLFLESMTEKQKEPTIRVKHFLIGGEALPVNLMVGFFDRLGEKAPKVTNIYGPTECTVDSSLYQVTAENIKELRNIPIGNAMPNCNLFIVSRWNNLQPVGIPGELLIGGHGVGVGYLNNPELTAEKFYRSYGSYKSNILTVYKTGDLARWQPDGPPAGGATKGIIEFLGRIDQQVKIRGFRIELGEIENRLSRHRAIKEAVVLVRKSGEDKYLCAYIVLKPGDSPAKTTNILSAEMKEFLLRDLPDYMVPA